MTYSLLARDEDGHTFGVATASKYLAVGATVPAVAAGVGALVTQAHTNVTYRERGLRHLRAGLTAGRTVDLLVEGDADADVRQVAVVASTGAPAAWTGPGCSPAAAHVLGDGCAAVGNLLTAPEVLDAMMGAFAVASGTLASRLLEGLAAGDAAGGDRRGRQSAALLVASGEGTVRLRTPARVDLRVDDHPDPVREMRRLLSRHELLVGEADPATAAPLAGAVEAQVDAALRALGRVTGAVHERLAAWALDENLEHRVLDGAVDRALLVELRRSATRAGRPTGGAGDRVRRSDDARWRA